MDTGEEEVEAADRLSLVVAADGTIDPEYPIYTLPGSADTSVQVVCVAELGDRILVAVPFTAWHKKTAKRVLGPKSLQKVTVVQVPCCTPDRRQEMDGEMVLKIWMGFLSPEAVPMLDLGDVIPDVEHEFGAEMEDPSVLPFAQGMVDAAQEHFAFMSAQEEDQQMEHGEAAGESGGMEARVTRLEELMQSVAKNLDALVGERAAPPKSLPKEKVKAKPKAAGKPAEEVEKFPLLDPGVVAASLAAGIEEEALEQMQKLLAAGQKGAKKLKENPLRKGVPKKVDELSESEDENILEVPAAAGSQQPLEPIDTVSEAVKQLTQIVVQLTGDKAKKPKASELENALDAVGGSTDGVAGVTSGKKAAAARRALRNALIHSPDDLSNLIEKLMYEDLTSTTLPPGMPRPKMSARAWVEHRSRIGSYRASAHAAWGISGVLDELFEGRYSAARARANLLLLQLDQAAADRGNWLLAGELSLENLPPLSRLAQHSAPLVSEGEAPYSRLLDGRWAEICLSHLKETEEFVTKRKNLSSRKADGGVRDGGGDDMEAEPKRRPRPKAKQRALPEAGAA